MLRDWLKYFSWMVGAAFLILLSVFLHVAMTVRDLVGFSLDARGVRHRGVLPREGKQEGGWGMKVIIRNETYEVHDPAMVKVDGRGVCPHLLLFSGEYWQRVALTRTDAERAASST